MIQALFLSFCMTFPISLPSESLANVTSQESRSTAWQGSLDAGGTKIRLEIKIVDDAGELTGELRSLDQNNANFDLAKIELDDQILRFVVPKAGAMFEGKLAENGVEAKGTFRQGGRSTPLVLSKFDAKASQVTPNASTDPLVALGQVVEGYVENEYAIGAELLVIEKGKTLYHESFGLVDREDNRKWKNDTLCNIRSMTKPITSAAAQLLIDRNKLELDAPVARYLKSFDNDKSRAITVRQVLTHRSGLPLTVFTTGPDQYSSLNELVAAAGQKGPEFEPGSKFWYSDAGTDVVGALVAEVSGEPLQDFVQREIFDPLEMTNTLYGIEASDELLSRAATGYMKMPQGWIPFWKPENPLYPFAWGSQTVYSTTTDYAKFLKMLMNRGRVGDRQVLSNDAVDRMLEPVSRAKGMGSDAAVPTGFRNLEVYYGQMMVTYRGKGDTSGGTSGDPVAIGHSGSDGTIVWAWPERELMILYFTQSRGGMTPLKIEDQIDELIIHPGDKEQIPEELRPYVGTFIANHAKFDGEEFTVKARNGTLVLDVPSQMTFELNAPDDQGFWAFAIAPGKIRAKFDRNENKEVVGLRLHQGGNVYEVPRKGTARAETLSKQKIASRAAEREKKSKEKLQAAWIGALDLGPMKPVMQFRVVSQVSGETAAYFDSVTEGQTSFDATWSIEGDQLKFDVAKINLKYRGKLNEARDMAKGTWSQGGREVPLTLKKQATVFGAATNSHEKK